MNPTMGAKEWLLLIILALVWGAAFFCTEVALRDLGPLTIMLARLGLASIALLAYLAATGLRLPRDRRLWRAFLIMGLLNNAVPFSLIAWGQVSIEGGLAAILIATTPLFSVLLGHWLTDNERITTLRLGGVLVGLGGVALLIGPGVLAGIDAQSLGKFAVLAAACLYACAAIYGRRFRGQKLAVIATGQVTCAALVLLPVALIVERPWLTSPDAATWSALLFLALVATALAYLIYFRLLASAGSTNVLLVTFLVPPSALLLGVLILDERPAWTALAGLALIFSGLAAVDGRLPRRLARRLA